MAKRRSTDKSPKNEAESKVDVEDVTDAVAADSDSDPGAPSDDAGAGETASPDTIEVDTVASDLSDDAIDQPDSDVINTDEAVEITEPDSDAAHAGDDGNVDDTLSSDEDQPSDADDAENRLTEEEAEELIIEAEMVEPASGTSDFVADAEGAEVAPQVIRETTIERKGGFGSMVLGGVVAAALGYGTAAFVSQSVWPFASDDTGFESEMRDALSSQENTVSDIAARVGSLEAVEIPTVDFGPVEDQIASVQATAADIASQLEGLAGRVEALEKQPFDQAVSPEAIAAYERALADLQADVEAQRAEVANMAKEAIQAEGNAKEQAKLAASRAALADLTTAIETGTGYAAALGVLSGNGVEVPEILAANAENGVATHSGLIEAFPDAARAALSVARKLETEGATGANRVATFFANQLGARSVAPREGDDPDAVLSRAEAAVRSGDMGSALTEISALPEAAQSALADWQSSAQTRLEAKTAADVLVQQLLQ